MRITRKGQNDFILCACIFMDFCCNQYFSSKVDYLSH